LQAVLFLARTAIGAFPAGINKATHANPVSHEVAGDSSSDRFHHAGYLVTDYQWVPNP
jgi:hypothetical protein